MNDSIPSVTSLMPVAVVGSSKFYSTFADIISAYESMLTPHSVLMPT